MRLKFNEKDLVNIAINLFEYWDPRNAKKRMNRILTRTRSKFSLVSSDKVIMERFGGIDRIPTLFVLDPSGREAFTFMQLWGPKKIHDRNFELTRVVEKLR